MDDAMDCLMSFSDFLFAFQIQFYYSGESFPGPHVAPVRATSACPSLVPFPSGAWHTRFPPPPHAVVCFTVGHRQEGRLVTTGGHKIESAEPTPSASSSHRKLQCLQSAGQQTRLGNNDNDQNNAHYCNGTQQIHDLSRTYYVPGIALTLILKTALIDGSSQR